MSLARNFSTIYDVERFRRTKPTGSTVFVPEKRLVTKKQEVTVPVAARVLESYTHIAVTTRGTFTWKEIYFLETGGGFE